MLQPDYHIDSALQVAAESMQEIVDCPAQTVEEYSAKTLATLRFFIQQLANSSQVTPEQSGQLHNLLVLLHTVPSADPPQDPPQKPRRRRKSP